MFRLTSESVGNVKAIGGTVANPDTPPNQRGIATTIIARKRNTIEKPPKLLTHFPRAKPRQASNIRPPMAAMPTSIIAALLEDTHEALGPSAYATLEATTTPVLHT